MAGDRKGRPENINVHTNMAGDHKGRPYKRPNTAQQNSK